MRVFTCVTLALLFATAMFQTANAAVVWSANFDTNLDAQVIPAGGVVGPTDQSGAIGISTGNKGFGGGEGLILPGATAFVEHKVDGKFPNTDWFPEQGTASLYFYVASSSGIGSEDDIALFDFDYQDGAARQSFMQLGIRQVGGVANFHYEADPFSAPIEVVDGAAMAVNPLTVEGWHRVDFTWDMVGSKPGTGSADAVDADINAYIDGVLALSTTATLGSPSTLNEFRVGSMSKGVSPLGAYAPISSFSSDNLYDEASISDTIIPEPASLGLMMFGVLLSVQRRKRML